MGCEGLWMTFKGKLEGARMGAALGGVENTMEVKSPAFGGKNKPKKQ